MCMCVYTHMLAFMWCLCSYNIDYVCMRTTCRSSVSSSTAWIPETELRSSHLVASTFTYSAILTVLISFNVGKLWSKGNFFNDIFNVKKVLHVMSDLMVKYQTLIFATSSKIKEIHSWHSHSILFRNSSHLK